MRTFRILCAVAIIVLGIAGCEREKPEQMKTPHYKKASFSDLDEWSSDNHTEALAAFIRTCPNLVKNGVTNLEKSFALTTKFFDWNHLCAEADKVLSENNPDAARVFFEQNFLPYSVSGEQGKDGLFTGYFEILLKGSREKSDAFPIPVLGRPADLLTIQLKDFPGIPDDLKSMTLFGRQEGDRIKVYPSREAIEKGLLDNQSLELAWLKDKVDLLYLQVQGSGIIEFEDGGRLRLGYVAKNGHPYGSVGKELVARGEMTVEQASMESIRAWFMSHPEQVDEIIATNPSYVFFRPILGDGPIGAAGSVLMPRRSLAVDLMYYDLGLPLWLDAEAPFAGGSDLKRLMIAQDTGGAIKGMVRGDFFWGTGPEAGKMAGSMKSKGRYYLLVPQAYQLKTP